MNVKQGNFQWIKFKIVSQMEMEIKRTVLRIPWKDHVTNEKVLKEMEWKNTHINLESQTEILSSCDI